MKDIKILPVSQLCALQTYPIDIPEYIAKITPKKVDTMYKINDQIENKEYALKLIDLFDIEDITPEFTNNYIKEANRFAKYGLEDVASSASEKINTRKAISDFLEEYSIDLTAYDSTRNIDTKLSGYTILELSKSKNKANQQKFLNSLSPQAKNQGEKYIKFIELGFSPEKLANLLNEYSKGNLGQINYNKLLIVMADTGSKDYDSMIDLIMAYKGDL